MTDPIVAKKLKQAWSNMKQRCYNSRGRLFKYYGARGITVCEDWRLSKAAFIDWALSSGYQIGLSLDRIDNDGPYSPQNCRWATKKQQGRNRRPNTLLTAFGETKTLIEWSEDRRCTISESGLHARIQRGMQPEEAIARPLIPLGSMKGQAVLTKEQVVAAYTSVKNGETRTAVATKFGVSNSIIGMICNGKAWADLGLIPIKNVIDHTGERNPSAKINPSQIEEIKRLYASGLHSQSDIGKMFDLHQTQVSRIIRETSWTP